MVNSNAIWNDLLEVGTAEKNVESMDDRWWILTLFGTMFGNRWENFESKDDILCLMTLFKTMFERISYLITTYSTF